VETALGIHHATGSRKNFLLMSGSFAFSIILFLSFGSLKNFIDHALVPLRPWSPDISIISQDNSCSIPLTLDDELACLASVKKVYARSFGYNIQGKIKGNETQITLISYEQHQLAWAKDMLSSGNAEDILKGDQVLLVDDGSLLAEPGDLVQIQTPEGMQEVEISGILSDCPFDREGEEQIVICSEELFSRLTGEHGCTIIDIQLKRGVSDEEVQKIRAMAGENITFSDQRMSNGEVMGAYYAFVLFLYGFLAVILMISAFHIINSMSMSVTARMREYGALRAIGMTGRQQLRMIRAEACTYAAFGIGAGCLAGLPVHRLFFTLLVTSRWGTPWSAPLSELTAVILVVLVSVALSVAGPSARIKNMSVAETLRSSE